MAKKVLTPEEYQAKLEKKAAKRKLFFGTFTKALAFFLAIAIAWSLAAIAFTPALSGNATVSGGAQTQQGGSDSSSDEVVDFGGDDSSSTPSGDSSTPSGDSGSASTPSGDSGSVSTGVSKADAIKALNDATAKASKMSYDWTRSAKFTKDIEVGALTSILDGIIKGVDENASLNSVVGGFLGIKEQPLAAKVKNGQLPEEGMGDEKYLLKAMTLTEGDVVQYKVTGNTYQFQIKDTTNPDENSAWAHASNDYITYADVNASIAGAVGEGVVTVVPDKSKAVYKNIVVKAVIDGGKLTSLEYSYTFDADLTIKVGFEAKGTGAAKMEAKYSNFA